MSARRVPTTQSYDIFKAAVTFILLFVVLLAVAFNNRTTQAAEEPEATLAPVVDLPPAIRDAEVVAGCIEVSGTGQPNSNVQLNAGDIEVGTTKTTEDGTWSIKTCVDPGEYQLVAVGVSSTGAEIGRSASFVVLMPAPTVAPTAAPVETQAPSPTPEATELAGNGQDYVVQSGDWLMGLARQFYGDASRWEDIYNATNEKAAEDSSYATIENPNALVPGWKIWIPLP